MIDLLSGIALRSLSRRLRDQTRALGDLSRRGFTGSTEPSEESVDQDAPGSYGANKILARVPVEMEEQSTLLRPGSDPIASAVAGSREIMTAAGGVAGWQDVLAWGGSASPFVLARRFIPGSTFAGSLTMDTAVIAYLATGGTYDAVLTLPSSPTTGKFFWVADPAGNLSPGTRQFRLDAPGGGSINGVASFPRSGWVGGQFSIVVAFAHSSDEWIAYSLT